MKKLRDILNLFKSIWYIVRASVIIMITDKNMYTRNAGSFVLYDTASNCVPVKTDNGYQVVYLLNGFPIIIKEYTGEYSYDDAMLLLETLKSGQPCIDIPKIFVDIEKENAKL